MTLAEKILKALDTNEYNETKLNTIKALALNEIRLQALKATPGKTKLSTTLTHMYKDVMRSDSVVCHGYVKMPTGFVITDEHFLIHVDGDPLELLPADAVENEKLTVDNVKRVLKSVEEYDRHDVTVSYSDVMAHIKTHGRSKKTLENQIFSIPNTDLLLNILYLEYAFKLVQTKELTLQVIDNKCPVYVQGKGWEMLICPICKRKDA